MTFYLLGIVCFFTLLSCTSSDQTESKFGAHLRFKIHTLEQDKKVENIGILGKCIRLISDSMKTEMEKTGIKISSVIKDIFTADGTPEEIRKLAGIESVTKLELSVEREIKLRSP